MYSVYILQSISSGKYYIGSTSNLVDRISRHNGNREKSTRGKGPWKIVYTEHCPTKSKSLQREKLIKSYKGGNAFKKLLCQNLNSTT